MCEVVVETERLILRHFQDTDADNLYALDNDPDVMRYLNGGIPTARSVIQEQILPTFLDHDPQAPGVGFLAAEEKKSRQFLGWLSLRPIDSVANEVAIGFRLRKSAWGEGYATEGAKAIIDRGFEKMGVQRIVATTYEENAASRRVLEKLGMKLLRQFRLTTEELEQVDTFHTDTQDIWEGYDLEYALTRAEWEKMQTADIKRDE